MITTIVAVVALISGGMGWVVVNYPSEQDVQAAIITAEHVPVSEFKQYIEQQQIADDREYVRDLKEDIRDVREALITRPDDEFLLEQLEDLMFDLCEFRPDDRMCEDQ